MTYDKTQNPKHVYHYTTIEGLLGILKSQSLHASNISYLNDRRELIYVDEFICEMIKNKFSSIYYDLQNQNKMTTNVDIGMLADKEAATFIDSIHETSKKTSPIFTVSFCRSGSEFEEQNGLLSQWRGYGRDGGVALRFEVEKLGNIIQKENEEYSYTSTFLGDVIYGIEDPEFEDIAKELTKFSDAVPDIMENMLKEFGIDYVFSGEKVSLDEMHRPYSLVAPRLKHPGFTEEKEYRIVASVWTGEESPDETRKRKPIQFRKRDNYLIPYITIGNVESGKLPIDQIIVGPSREMARRTDSIYALASAFNVESEII